jgi:hypothetical protein
VADLTCGDQVADGACVLLDRDVGVDAVLVVKVDGVDAEAAQ